MNKIIEDLRSFVRHPEQRATFALRLEDAQALLAEIDHLHSVAGTINDGPSWADIRKTVKRSTEDDSRNG